MHWTEARRGLIGATLCCSFGLVFFFTALRGWAQQPAPSAPKPPAGIVPSAPTPLPAFPTGTTAQVQPQFVVVIDAAHGGTDAGASISEHILEKDVVLSLAVRLRSTLAARGIAVVTTRESDASLTVENRAGTANHARAAACISLHATASGSGVHLFTSSLSQAPAASRFLPWQSAQAAFSTQSLRLSSEINSALAHAQVPVILGRTSIQPLDNLACPAVALEIAPLASIGEKGGTALADAEYQRRVIDAVAAALQQWRNDWRQQP